MNVRTLAGALRPICCLILCSIAMVSTAAVPGTPISPDTAGYGENASPGSSRLAQVTDAPAETTGTEAGIDDTTPPPPDLTQTRLSYKTIAGGTIVFMISTSAAFAIWAGLMIYKTNKRKS